ncbi:hypothetical protein L1987_40995 [Smallanthus sonchifolius]|uniref:Uncharacterized protein n=1 Tax=Smallanthus sonchifolius TaxID=185202 RepID=A0ACB9GV43_9ASTR|nr:hypothetical protein L1987_40995 [Smallanthus sonchifolius]
MERKEKAKDCYVKTSVDALDKSTNSRVGEVGRVGLASYDTFNPLEPIGFEKVKNFSPSEKGVEVSSKHKGVGPTSWSGGSMINEVKSKIKEWVKAWPKAHEDLRLVQDNLAELDKKNLIMVRLGERLGWKGVLLFIKLGSWKG